MTANPKTKEAKTLLIARSAEAKAYREGLIANATTDTEMLAAASLTINDVLIMFYTQETGAKVWHTYKDWLEKGYQVRKGEKSFRIWARPRKATEKVQDVKTGEEAEHNYQFWPMCSLFGAHQVDKIDENAPEANDIAQTKPERPAVEPTKPATNSKLAGKLRSMANTLQKTIDNKLGDRLTNTPKRMKEAAHARLEGERLQRCQQAMRALADLHESGNLPPVLSTLTTKGQIYDLLATKLDDVCNGYHGYSICTGKPRYDSPEAKALWALLTPITEEELHADELRKALNDLQFSKIPGYFRTPESVVDLMLDRACVEHHHLVIEPSAGDGAIACKLPNPSNVSVFEVNHSLCQILNLRGFDIESPSDFLDFEPLSKADRILMNPPFENMQDIDHIRHAYTFLKEGGRLVAIMSPGNLAGKRKKSVAFREWLDELGAEIETLPENSFKESGTNVSTLMVIIDK